MSSITITEETLDTSPNLHGKSLSVNSDLYQKTLIGKAVAIKGELTAREDILIDGFVEGSISLKNNRLEIGLTGCIQADTFARSVVINGEMKGDVYAKDQVIVTKTGRVYGNIFAGDIHIEDGALLKGSINMDMQDVIRDHFSEEDQENDTNESSAFGFLFGKKKALPELGFNENEAANPDNTLPVSPVSTQATSVLEHSFIGKTVILKGQIEADEDVMIQGEIDGVVHFKNNGLEIGQQAKICATIFVNSLVTYGDIKGDIYASECVSLKKPAHVFGTIRSPRVSIERGAILMGNIEMEQQDIEKSFANIDVAKGVDVKPRQEQSVREDKVAHVTEGQYTVSKQPTVANRSERVPWPE